MNEKAASARQPPFLFPGERQHPSGASIAMSFQWILACVRMTDWLRHHILISRMSIGASSPSLGFPIVTPSVMIMVIQMLFINRILTAVSLASASLALFAIASAAEAEPTAQTRWEVDYGNTRCRLIRHFGEAGQSYRLMIERNWTFGGYHWALYGSALPLHSSMTSVEITLGRNDVRRFKLKSYAVTEGEERLAWDDPDGLMFKGMREGDRLHLTAARKLDLSLNLTNLKAAIQALEKCEDDMWGNWGFSPQQIRSLSKRAEPSNYAGRWATNDDYPRADFVNKNEGTTTFLLHVDAKGAVTRCRIVDSSGFQSLDQQTCALMLIRAAFHPARDADGNAVESFYINRVRWQLPR